MSILDSLKVGPLPLYTKSRCRKEELGDEFGAINHLLLNVKSTKMELIRLNYRRRGMIPVHSASPFFAVAPTKMRLQGGLQEDGRTSDSQV